MKRHWKDKQKPNIDAYLSRQRGSEVLGVGVGMMHLSACIFLYCVDFLNHAENHQPVKVNLCGKALSTLNEMKRRWQKLKLVECIMKGEAVHSISSRRS